MDYFLNLEWLSKSMIAKYALCYCVRFIPLLRAKIQKWILIISDDTLLRNCISRKSLEYSASTESHLWQYNNNNIKFFSPIYLLSKHTFLDLHICVEFSYRSERDSGGAVLRSLAHVNSLKRGERGVRMTKSRSIANLSGM